MNKFLKIMYLKYVIGHCRHICFLCKFKKNKCWEEMWEDIKMCDWKSLFRYKKIKDKVKIDVEGADKLEEAKNILQGKLDCMIKCDVFDCKNTDECDDCNFCYAQGTFREQKETLRIAIKLLEETQKGKTEWKWEEMF